MRRLITPQSSIRRTAATRDGMYHGRLAEDYDGIGQYVLVSLAGSSVAAAYKARVAAGDFGGGRTFPRGTPVAVAAHRGNLEIFLGNSPKECHPDDDFERSVSDSFGGGGLGWTQYQTAGLQSQRQVGVDGSRAFLRATTSNTVIYLGGLNTTAPSVMPVEFYAEIELAAIVGVNGATAFELEFNPGSPYELLTETEIRARWASGVQTLEARIAVTDGVTFIDTLAAKTDYPTAWITAPLATRIQFQPDRIQAKLWPVSGNEPTEWEVINSGPFSENYFDPLLSDHAEIGAGLRSDELKTVYIDYFKITQGIDCDALKGFGT